MYDEIEILGNKACLFHFPIAAWDRQQYGSWHLHGHSHGGYQPDKGKILDVGLDNAYNVFGRHKFFKESEIAEYMKTREKQINDYHKERE